MTNPITPSERKLNSQEMEELIRKFLEDRRMPCECETITEVRNEIDNIDNLIIKLLAQRFQYVKEVVKYKTNTAESVVAEDRRKAVLAQRRLWAEEIGLSPDVIEEMYINLINYFIQEEKKILNIK